MGAQILLFRKAMAATVTSWVATAVTAQAMTATRIEGLPGTICTVAYVHESADNVDANDCVNLCGIDPCIRVALHFCLQTKWAYCSAAACDSVALAILRVGIAD